MTMFLLLITVLIATAVDAQNGTFELEQKLLNASTGEIPAKKYDFIVVGGGSAGKYITILMT